MKLSVHLVTWNGAKYVPYLFDSLKKQTYRDWKLYIWDNASEDGMVEAMQKELKDLSVEYEYIKNNENKGFAGGHNELYRRTNSEYFLLLNQDMYLMPDCLEKLVAFMDEQERVAAVSPRLMRWNFEDVQNLEKSFTNKIDSLGLKVFRNRRVIEWLTTEVWESDSSSEQVKSVYTLSSLDVFGVSGALPLFRRTAIDAVAFSDDTFFDESYHSYKEDVDLAFRLRSAGYEANIVLDAVAYHDRSAAGPSELSDLVASKNKKNQSSWVKMHSYKNHLMTLYKNEYWQNFFLDFLPIIWYEMKKLGWFLLFDRGILKGLFEIWSKRKKLKQKKLEIKKQRNISPKEIRKWWTMYHVYEQSFGAIPIRDKDGIREYLIIQHTNGDWGLPKGHSEAGEDGITAAKRELKEETGIDVIEMKEDTAQTSMYTFKYGNQWVHKIVTYFPAYIDYQTDIHLDHVEVKDAVWLSYEDATLKVSFDETRKILKAIENNL